MRKVAFIFGVSVVATLSLAVGCSGGKKDGSSSSTNSTVSGRLAALSVSSLKTTGGVQAMSTKQITHVLAVSPSTGNAERFVAPVAADKTFSLALKSGKPYVIVFVSQDGILTGPDMIVGTVTVAANGLDTIPIAQPGTVALGEVTVSNSSSTANATLSTSVPDLLASMGITSDEATYIGGIDDLALRLANPDVDVNGVIDATEDKNFGMDWHIRADSKLNNSALLITDIENTFAAEANVSLTWTLGSGYAVYPTSFDNVNYVVNSGVSPALQNGGAFAVTATGIAASTMSGGTFGSSRQWGPDYNMGSQELGASDVASTFTYTLGSKTLKFSNVKTKTKAQLNADGVMLPFIKINTASNKLTGISYKWMKRVGSAWTQATVSEVSLLVQDQGAYLNLYTARSAGVENGLSFKIPSTSATGTINIGTVGNTNTGVASPTNVALTDICNIALSYDDKIGLRIFAGAPVPANGVTVCN